MGRWLIWLFRMVTGQMSLGEFLARIVWTSAILSARANPHSKDATPEENEWRRVYWRNVDALGWMLGNPPAPMTAKWVLWPR